MRRKTTRKKAAKSKSSPPRRPPRPASTPAPASPPDVSVSAEWFEMPLVKALQKTMRPPTALSRRKQITIKMMFPKESFDRFVQPLQESDCAELSRAADGRPLPTKESKVLRRYNFKISKPSALDRLFRFEALDLRSPAGGRRRGAFRRGYGAARLHLSAAAQRRGRLAMTISMACGNVLLNFKEPVDCARAPTLSISFFVMTMDEKGHILWPTVFGQKSRAMLRKRAREHLLRMLEDPAYPVDDSCRAALSAEGNTVWEPAPRRMLTLAPATAQ